MRQRFWTGLAVLFSALTMSAFAQTTAFTYQGRLLQNSANASGSYDFRFTLYTDVSGTTQVGTTLYSDDLNVSGGLFTTLLDFGSAAFSGAERYLEIAVRSGNIANTDRNGYTGLNPRQRLTSTPYAITARNLGLPYAASADLCVGNGKVFSIVNANSGNGNAWSIYGENNGTAGTAIVGLSRATSGINTGVIGWNSSPLGYGLYGYNQATTGNAIGVLGESRSATGYGGYFMGNGYFSQNVGIGAAAPAFPLTFRDALGDKVSFFGNSGAHYGIGIQPSLLQIHTSASGEDIAFGYGSSESFTERVRFKGNGTVGININSPSATLHVNALNTSDTASFQSAKGPNMSHIQYGVNGDWYIRSAKNEGEVILQDTGGFVGVGTSNPEDLLSVAGSIVVDQNQANNGTPASALRFGSQSGEAIASRRQAGANQYGLDFYTQFIPRLSIDNNGFVGIGTRAPFNPLQVSASNGSGIALPNGVHLGMDTGVNAHLELVTNNATPYIDFSNDNTSDADARLILTNDNTLMLSGATFSISGGGLTATGSKAFRIDHPLDPARSYLQHFAIESPEVLNVYRGNVVCNVRGEAIIELPSYFEAINKEFSYQLTCVGGYAPVYVAEEIKERRFKIAGGKPGLKVSWQVTAERNDPYMQAYPSEVEPLKGEKEQGKYLNPELYNQPEETRLGNVDLSEKK